MPILSQHAKGLIITALGVLLISPDGLLTRLILVDHWTLIFWRALFLSFGMWLIVSLIYPNKAWHKYKSMGRGGAIMVLIYAMGTISFIVAITHTSVANTLIILSTTPDVCRNHWMDISTGVDSRAHLDRHPVGGSEFISLALTAKARHPVCSAIWQR